MGESITSQNYGTENFQAVFYCTFVATRLFDCIEIKLQPLSSKMCVECNFNKNWKNNQTIQQEFCVSKIYDSWFIYFKQNKFKCQCRNVNKESAYIWSCQISHHQPVALSFRWICLLVITIGRSLPHIHTCICDDRVSGRCVYISGMSTFKCC